MIRKKILYICSEASAGIVPYAANIIKSASKSSLLDVYAITIDDNKLSYRWYFDESFAGKITFLKMPSDKKNRYLNKIYALEILEQAKKICKNENIDIIHLLTIDYSCTFIVSQLKKSGTVYYTVHDLQPHEKVFRNMKERLFFTYMEWAIKHNMKQTDHLVTNSKSQYNAIKKSYPQKNVHFHTFPSLIMDSILNGENTCPEIKDVKKYILYFGYLEKYKGVEYLYEAFRNNQKLHDYQLVIAGSGNIYFTHDNDPRVIFINRYIKDDEIKSLFKQASCVVYPYISATQSGVLTLAYKLRVPVLASDIPFFKENSGKDCCLFFKSMDTNDLSGQLEKLLMQTDLKKMKEAQKEFYDHNYAETAIVSSIEGIY